jgi:hypothetical protein
MVEVHLNQAIIVDAQILYVVIEAVEPFDLVNLAEVHLILYHSVARLENILLAVVTVDLLYHGSSVPVGLHLNGSGMGLKLLEDLLARKDLLYLRIDLGLLIPIENVIDRLELIVYHK